MSSTGSVAGRRALVTGAGRGIGRAIAVQLGSAGVAVALVARSIEELEQTAELVRAAGGSAVVLPADLGGPDVAAVARRASGELGAVDIVINNAAVVTPLGAGTAGIALAEWNRALAVNLTAPAVLATVVLPGMIDAGWGRIVNVSSGVAARPDAMIGANAYATTKAALEAHTINLAGELAGTGVTANVYRPGVVDTSMQELLRAQDGEAIGTDLPEQFRRMHEEGRLITPAHSARSLVSRLPSDDNGRVWTVHD